MLYNLRVFSSRLFVQYNIVMCLLRDFTGRIGLCMENITVGSSKG